MSNRIAVVRPATFEDVFAIERTVTEMAWPNADIPLPEPERPYVVQYGLDLIARRLVHVAEVETVIVGCIMLDTHHWPWNRKSWYLENQHFWIEPKFRKGGVAAKLIAAAKATADDMKMPLRLCFTSDGRDADLKDRFMRMQGFKYQGGNFFFHPK
jgi:GNAT superfamily N-acetyltransferase